MIVAQRKEEISLFLKKKMVFTEIFKEHFLEQQFFPIIDFIESKGFLIKIPSVIEGEDATFIYKKLQNFPFENKGVEKFSLFLHMRLSNKTEIELFSKGIFQ